MADSLVFLTEPDTERCRTVRTLLERVPGTAVSTFDSLALTRKAMRSRVPHLMIGPWSQGGETMLATRSAASGNAAYATVPQALILSERISPSRISLTRQAGSAELIPCDPLDEDALFNRVMLLLRGADALYASLEQTAPCALESALENLPALKRRLVA